MAQVRLEGSFIYALTIKKEMKKEHKLSLRLRESNPLHRRAWEKIENSGMSKQEYLLNAVLAYEVDEMAVIDFESVVAEVIRQLDEKGYIIGAADSSNSAPTNELMGED